MVNHKNVQHRWRDEDLLMPRRRARSRSCPSVMPPPSIPGTEYPMQQEWSRYQLNRHRLLPNFIAEQLDWPSRSLATTGQLRQMPRHSR